MNVAQHKTITTDFHSVRVIQASDGSISLSIPITLKHRSGRKLINLPQNHQPDERPWGSTMTPLQQALVRGHRWLRMLNSGEFSSVVALAKHLGVNSSYVGRMLNLTTLAPDIVAAILDDCLSPSMKLLDLAINTPLVWEQQYRQHRPHFPT